MGVIHDETFVKIFTYRFYARHFIVWLRRLVGYGLLT